MEATRRALPKGPAGRARHGKRLPQEGTSSSPTVIIGLPVSNPGFTDTGLASGGTGAGLGAGTNTGVGSTGTASDDPTVGDTGDARTVTVIKAGTQFLTTIGASTAAATATTSIPLAQSLSSSIPSVSSPSSIVSSISTSTSTSNKSPSPSPSTKSSTVDTSSASTSSTAQQSQQDASASGTSAVGKGVSPAAIAGILIFVSIAVIAALIWFIRKRMMAKRQQKRATRTWTTNMFIKGSEAADPEAAVGTNHYTSNAYAGSYLSEKPSTPPAIVTDFGSTIPSTLRPGQGQGRGLSPVPAGLSPAGRSVAPNLSLTPPASQYNAGGAAYMSPSLVIPPATFAVSGGGDNRTALVRCTYIPRLPDELSITTGQMITVNNTYDDGWALCTNDRGDQGVVPLDCLNAVGNSAGQSGDGIGAGQVQRASSLRRF